MEYLQVTFRVRCAPAQSEALVESLLLEQTVETPLKVAERNEFVRRHMLGHVVRIETIDEATVAATLALPTVNARTDPAQFLNVLFGNASLHESVSLEDFELPPAVAGDFDGPRFGAKGIRRRLAIEDRPLTCSALKPVGLTSRELADLCYTLALGGIDVIKDDHYLADHSLSPFRERVVACQQAVERAADRTGKRTLYCPNLSGLPETIHDQAEFAQELGVGALMIAPMLSGLPLLVELRRKVDVPLLLHPSFGGSTRIRPDTLYGRIFRLFGGDAVIFASYGGRFSYSAAVCRSIADRLRDPWHHLRPSLPVPAGGMSVERVPELIDFFRNETMLLVGGSLLSGGDALLDRTRAFTSMVAEHARKLERPE